MSCKPAASGSGNFLWRGRRGQGSDRLGDSHGDIPCARSASRKEPSWNARSPASEWMAGVGRVEPGDGALHFIHQGLHIRDITGITHGQMQGKDEARRGPRRSCRACGQTGRAVAVACANGRNSGIVGIDDFAVAQRLARRQPAGLGFDPLMGLERGREWGVQAHPRLLRQLRQAGQALRYGPGQRQDLMSMRQRWVSVWRTSVTNTLPIPPHCRPKRRISCWRSCWRCRACSASSAPCVVPWAAMDAMTWRTFFWPYTTSRHH